MEINELIFICGMVGMMNIIWLIICVMCFGGVMIVGGMFGSIIFVFVCFMKKWVGMVLFIVVLGLFLNFVIVD